MLLPNDPPEYETRFFKSLVNEIETAKLKCEVHRSAILGYRGQILRPFVLIPSFGIVVDIDLAPVDPLVLLHSKRQRSFQYDRLFLTSPNQFAFNEEEVNKHLIICTEKVVDHMIRHPIADAKRVAIRVAICGGRKTIANKNILKEIGQINGQSDLRHPIEGFNLINWWGGQKYVVR